MSSIERFHCTIIKAHVHFRATRNKEFTMTTLKINPPPHCVCSSAHNGQDSLVIMGLEGSVFGNTQVLGLLVGQLSQVSAKSSKMQTGHILVWRG